MATNATPLPHRLEGTTCPAAERFGKAIRGSEHRTVNESLDLAVTLRRRGYVRQRWFPVGAGFVHGFAVATRLEHFDTEDGSPELERWLPWHPEPANLFWLSGATTVRLPLPGHYRVLLVAFTDLPLGPTRVAPVWGKDTVMEGPEVPETLSAEEANGKAEDWVMKSSPSFEIWARSRRPQNGAVLRALASDDVDAALEATRALSRLLDDPSLTRLDVPPGDC